MATAEVPEPPGTTVPFSSTAPADVRVHLLPLLSVSIPPEVVVSSFGVGVGVGVGGGVGVGVGVEIRTGAAELVQAWLESE
jgi:hypothetical protein